MCHGFRRSLQPLTLGLVVQMLGLGFQVSAVAMGMIVAHNTVCD
jgi:hypothetical protein